MIYISVILYVTKKQVGILKFKKGLGDAWCCCEDQVVFVLVGNNTMNQDHLTVLCPATFVTTHTPPALYLPQIL